MKSRQEIEHMLHKVIHVLELVMAFLMVVGIVLAIIGVVTDFPLFRGVVLREHAFIEYIERVFAIVIGIEFLEMLCAPTSDSVIQTLIFLVARHMIVGETTPIQDLTSIASIAILVVLRRWLHASREDPIGIAPLLTVRRILSRRDGKAPSSPKGTDVENLEEEN